MAAEQERLATAQQHIAFLKMSAARPQAFDLPPLQSQTGFVVFLDEIFVIRLLVAGDLSVAGWFFAHKRLDIAALALVIQRALLEDKRGFNQTCAAIV